MSAPGKKFAHAVSRIGSEPLTLIPFDITNNSHNEFLFVLWNTALFIASNGKTGIDSVEKAKGFIERRWIPSYTLNVYGHYIVALKHSENGDIKFIGTVGLTLGESPQSYTAPDLGFAILPEFTGKGYATTASKLLLEHVSKEFEIVEVFGFCNPNNGASRKVLEKTGLEFRGLKKLDAFGETESAVYAMPGMNQNLSIYGLKE